MSLLVFAMRLYFGREYQVSGTIRVRRVQIAYQLAERALCKHQL